MSTFGDAIVRFLFPMYCAEAPRAEASGDGNDQRPKSSLPITMNDHAYYVHRLTERITKAHRNKYGTRDRSFGFDRHESTEDLSSELENLTLNTLQMLDEYKHLAQIDHHLLREEESLLRSALYASARDDTSSHSIHSAKNAVKVLIEYHGVPKDITEMQPKHADAVSAACHFIIKTGLHKNCPPRLSAFVMEHPDRVEDILEYVATHCGGTDAIHHIDLDHVAEFLTSPSQPLREGAL